MEPSTIIGVASFALSLFGGGNSGIPTIIRNQIRILSGLTEIANQLTDLSRQIAEIDSKLQNIEADISTFQEVARIKATMLKAADIYLILDRRIAQDDEIDFPRLLDDLTSVWTEACDRLRTTETLIESDGPTNNLLAALIALDGVAWALMRALLDPKSLWDGIRQAGATRLTGPNYDARLDLADVDVLYLERVGRLYKNAQQPLLVQRIRCFTAIEPFIWGTAPQTDERNRETVLPDWEDLFLDEAARQTEHRPENILMSLSYSVISRWAVWEEWEKSWPEGSGSTHHQKLDRTVITEHQKLFWFFADGNWDEWIDPPERTIVPNGGDVEGPTRKRAADIYDDKMYDHGPDLFDNRLLDEMDARVRDMEGITDGKYAQRNAMIALSLEGLHYKSTLAKVIRDRITELDHVAQAGVK